MSDREVSKAELGAFGISANDTEEQEVIIDEDSEEESESEEENASEEEESEGENLSEEEVAEDDKPEEKPANGTKTDKQLREFQSRADKAEAKAQQLESQVQQLYNEFIKLKTDPLQDKDSPKQDIDLDDDDLIDGKTLKKILSKNFGKQVDEQQHDQTRIAAENEWLQNQKDLDNIKEYITKKNLSSDPQLASIPTNAPGYYYAVKAKQQEELISSMKKQIAKLSGDRKSIPPTGGKSSQRQLSKTGSKSKLSLMERQFENLGRKYGIDLSTKSV